MTAIVQAISLGKQVPSGEKQLNILHEASFTVHEGESLAIVGASGSGKSTLLGLLAGLDVPSQGTVMLNGVDLFLLDEDGRARLRGELAGFVFQSFQLLPALSALENVMLPLELQGVADAKQRAMASLREVGLADRSHHLPKHLSGGEQQRVAIARALAMRPKAMLFDEPTASLDPEMVGEVLSVIRDLVGQEGMTTIIATHEMGFAREAADRIVVFDNGDIIETGRPELIFTTPKNARTRMFLSRILERL